MHFSSLPRLLHSASISTSFKPFHYLASKNYEVPHTEIFSSHQLPLPPRSEYFPQHPVLNEPGQRSRYSDGLCAGWPVFDSRQGHDFSLLHNVQTGSGTHPASYPIGTVCSFSGGKAASGRGVNLTTHLHLVPRSSMVELYLHSPDTSSWHSA
jgi:hypothetical protein